MLSCVKELGDVCGEEKRNEKEKMSSYASYSCFVCRNESLWLTVNRWSHMSGCLGKSL